MKLDYQHMAIKAVIASLAAMLCAPVFAGVGESNLARLVGYTLVYHGNITGFRDSENPDKADSLEFEGCDFGRYIFIDHAYCVKCVSFGFALSIHPEAFLFSRNGRLKLLVEDELYDVVAPR